jgi:bacterial/archaeal transporter family-2 protein
MNFIISLLIGAITSVMILLNGTLADGYGNFSSAILIHVVGLLAIILVCIISKTKFKLQRGIPIYLYSAGCIGVFTVLFTNMSYVNLGVALTLSLGLFGQSIFSVFVDHFGLFGMNKTKFNPKKLIGLGVIIAGIAVMAAY